MPLAIVQAAGYINHHAPHCPVSRYLEKFRKCDREIIIFLKHEAGHLNQDWVARSSILVTWQLSFDDIQNTRKSAADLLFLIGFFNLQGILISLLQIDRGSSNIADEADTDEP